MASTVDLARTDLLSLIGKDTTLHRAASTNGGEHAGPCPFCGGDDRFRVWPDHPNGKGQWWCRQCGKSGDAIDYLRTLNPGWSFAQAVQALGGSIETSPVRTGTALPAGPRQPEGHSAPWQERGSAFVSECEATLWSDTGARALDWLRKRCLSDDTIRKAHLGYNAQKRWEDRALWELPPELNAKGNPKRVCLPRGIVVPWTIGGQLWRIQVRKPEGGYYNVPGSANALYNFDSVKPDRPAMLVEGVFDALTVMQEAGDLIIPVAAGSTTGAHCIRWVGQLSRCPLVLVSFDAEKDKGDKAAAWWVDTLENARRWRPYYEDVNAMVQAGADISDWVLAGVGDHMSANAQDAITADGRSRSDLEAEAAEILRENPTEPGAQLDWCRRYAARMTELEISCFGYASWAEWVADAEADLVSQETRLPPLQPSQRWLSTGRPLNDGIGPLEVGFGAA
jgi:DNA primase